MEMFFSFKDDVDILSISLLLKYFKGRDLEHKKRLGELKYIKKLNPLHERTQLNM